MVKPVAKQLVLNTNGYSLGNLGVECGGGILRDGNGNLVFAFLVPFDIVTSIQAEVKTLLFGVH